MSRQTTAKRERVIEAVRQGLEGDDAVAFVMQSGFAMNTPGVARHLRAMGGRGRIKELIDRGMTNAEILAECFPDGDTDEAKSLLPEQAEFFDPTTGLYRGASAREAELFPTTKLSVTLPSELYEAIRAAARGEGKSQNQLIVELLTASLSRMTAPVQRELDGD